MPFDHRSVIKKLAAKVELRDHIGPLHFSRAVAWLKLKSWEGKGDERLNKLPNEPQRHRVGAPSRRIDLESVGRGFSSFDATAACSKLGRWISPSH